MSYRRLTLEKVLVFPYSASAFTSVLAEVREALAGFRWDRRWYEWYSIPPPSAAGWSISAPRLKETSRSTPWTRLLGGRRGLPKDPSLSARRSRRRLLVIWYMLRGLNTTLSSPGADTGESVWAADVGGNVESAPTVLDGVVYPTVVNNAYPLDEMTREVIWQVNTEEFPARDSPALVVDGGPRPQRQPVRPECVHGRRAFAL